MRKTWALVMAAAMAAASLTACSSSKPAETIAPETEAEAAETEETEAEAEAAGDQQEILVAAAFFHRIRLQRSHHSHFRRISRSHPYPGCAQSLKIPAPAQIEEASLPLWLPDFHLFQRS